MLTKCLCEDRDLAQWTLLLDADEYWVSLPPAPQLGLGQFLAKLPASQQQHLFCTAEEACNLPVGPRAARYRPKAALRSGRCSWLCRPALQRAPATGGGTAGRVQLGVSRLGCL